jgi:hypothetical protein
MQALVAKSITPVARCALGLAMVFAPMVVAAMEAPDAARHSPAPIMRRLLDDMAAKAQKPVRKELVWSGADVDGDGAADFANPTGAAPPRSSQSVYGSP